MGFFKTQSAAPLTRGAEWREPIVAVIIIYSESLHTHGKEAHSSDRCETGKLIPHLYLDVRYED